MIDYDSIARSIEALYMHMRQRDLNLDMAAQVVADRNSSEKDSVAYIESANQCHEYAKHMMEYIAVRFKQDLESMPNDLKDLYHGAK